MVNPVKLKQKDFVTVAGMIKFINKKQIKQSSIQDMTKSTVYGWSLMWWEESD